jgi:hypothetical protein
MLRMCVCHLQAVRLARAAQLMLPPGEAEGMPSRSVGRGNAHPLHASLFMLQQPRELLFWRGYFPFLCRGLRTAMIEREDFAAGTSSRSTKLVHGGVRYLEKVGG